MTVSGKDKRGLVEELRTLRTRLDRLERQNAELTRAEKELRESLGQFKTMFEDSPLGLYRTTPDGRILMANSTLVNMLGYSSFEDLARRNLENEGYDPAYPRSAFKERIEREGNVHGLEAAWKRSDGKTVHIRESAQAVRDEIGNTIYYQGTVENITEQKQAKSALRESEETFGALVRNLREGVDIVDENLRCLFANRAGEEIFGVGPGGLVGRSIDEFVSNGNLAILEEQRSKRRGGIGGSYNIEIVRPDGQKRQLIVTGTPRFSLDGKYIGAMSVFFDITEMKQTEEALRKTHGELETRVQERTAELQRANEALCERELSLNLALQVAHLGHWDWDIRSNKTQCSDEIYRMFDVRPQEVQFTYEQFLEFVHPSDRESVKAGTQAVQKGDGLFDMEFRIITPKGQERTVYCRAAVFRSQTDEPVRMIGTIQDVTERKKTERQIRERARIIDSTTDSVIKTDRNGVVTMWNRGAERVFGYTCQEMMGQPVNRLYSQQEQGRLAEIIQTLLKGEEIATAEVTCMRKDGSPVELALSLLPFKDDGGNVTEFVGISKDVTERKRIQDALRQSENRYRTVIENAGEGIVVVQDGILRLVNSRHTFVTGRSVEESTSRPFIEFVHPDDRKLVAEIHAARLKGEPVPQVYEFRIIDKDEKIRWLENNGVLIEWNGRPASLNFLRNVTDRKQAAEALCQSENRYRTVIENAEEGIIVTQDETLGYVNPRILSLTGYSREELTSQPFVKFIHPDDQKQVVEIHAARIKGEPVPHVYEFRIIDKDGKIRWLENNGVLIEWNGRPASLNFLRDVTARKSAEEALREREEMIRALVETSRDWIWSIDVHGVHTYCNPAVEQILGYTAEELVGKCSFDLIHEDDKKMVEANLSTWIAEKRGWSNLLLRWRHKDGTCRYLESSAVPILNSEGELVGFRGVDRDVTDRKKAEDELRIKAEILENMVEGVHITDENGVIVLTNPGLDAMFGYEPGELTGRHVSVLNNLPQEQNARFVQSVIDQLQTEGMWSGDCCNIKKDGTPFISSSRISTLDLSGKKYWISVQYDITDRKKAEEEKSRLLKAIETSKESMSLTTPDGIIVYTNPAMDHLFGYERGELLGQHVSVLTSGPQAEALVQEALTALAKEGSWEGEVLNRKKDGTEFFTYATNSVVKDEKGCIVNLIGTQNDITDLKNAEEQLRKERDKAQQYLDVARVVIVALDVEGRVTLINRKGSELLGYREQDIIGKNWFDNFLPERLREQVKHIFGELMAGRWEPVEYFENPILIQSGRERLIAWHNITIRDGAGNVTGCLSSGEDITDRREAEDELLEKTRLQQILLDSMPCVALLLRPGSREIVASNRAAVEVGAVPGKTCYQTWAKSDSPCPWCKAPEVWATGQARQCEPVGEGGTIWDAHWVPVSDDLYMHFAFNVTESRQAEKVLRETTALLETIFAHTHILVAYLDPQFNFVRVNHAYARADGCEPSFFVGRNHFDLYPSAENEAIFRRVVEIGSPYFAHAKPFEYAGQPERPVTYWDWSLVPIKDQNGAVSGLVLTLVNVTEQKNAEQALRESEERFRKVFEEGPIGMVLTSRDMKFFHANPAFCKMLGYTVEEMSTKTFLDVTHPAHCETDRQNVEKMWRGEIQHYTTEKRYLTRNGDVCWGNLTTSLIQGQGGEPTYAIAIVEDITERKQAEEALREREATLTSIFRTAPVGIGLERGLVLARVNDTICEMSGYSREELVGQDAKMFYPSEEDYERVKAETCRQVDEKGKGTVETQWKRKDGRVIDVLLSTTVFDPSDLLKGVTFTALDITERKAAEAVIRESEEKFRTLAEQSPNMIFINKRGRVIYANRKCEEIMGYTREEFYHPDFDFRVLIASESADIVTESFARHSRGEEMDPYECSLVGKTGERLEALLASRLIQFEGQITILGIVTNITDQKRAERELRESQERFKILFESAPDAIYLMDLEGRFVDGNKAAEEMVGFAKAELIGKSLAESGLLSADDLVRAAANLKKTASGQSPPPTEYIIRRKSGSLITVEIRTFRVAIGGKNLCLGIARDVTARKHAEEAIRASEKKFRSIFETAANLITSVNEQGIIVDCNDKVREFLGYEKEEIMGRPMARIIHPDYMGKAQSALKEILTRGFSYNKEYKMVRKDGSLVDVSINSSAIEDERGKNTRTLCIIDDITERKLAQQRLLDDREQLKSLASQLSLTEERERHRLATALHDHIGQSLVFSKIKLDQVRKSGVTGEVTAALNDVSHHLAQVIQETRTLTFDLSDPILYELGFEAAVSEWLTEQVQEKHGIVTEFQDDGRAKPLDDDIRALLFRNVRELLTNVIKHARAQRVKVAVEKADRNIYVIIEDDGVGFDPDEAAAMALKKAEFGLFSIRERLEQLGGRVEIESRPGWGTTIRMIAPLKNE